MTDRHTWVTDTSKLLLAELPLQSLNSGIVYVESYLSDTGGWVPDDPMDPLGDGFPFSGQTEQEAADTITANQFAQVYDLNFDLTVTLNAQLALKLGTGLDITGAKNAMKTTLEEFVIDSINDSTIPIRIDSITTEVANAGSSSLGGVTSSAIRVVIAAEVIGADKIDDFKAKALKFARDTYGLNMTWNVRSVYTEANSPIVVLIRKYTSTSYVTLDVGDTTTYVFSISPVTYEVVTGAILA